MVCLCRDRQIDLNMVEKRMMIDKENKNGCRNRGLLRFAVLLILLLVLSGCGEKEVPTTEAPPPEKEYIGDTARNTIRLSGNGNVLEIAVEDYTGVDYDIEKLKNYIQSEVDSFNQTQGVNKVNFREILKEGDVIKTAISYTDLDAFNAFNRMSIRLVPYDPAEADRIAKEEAKKKEAEITTEENKPAISETELAEAGYDPSELEQQEIQETVEQEVTAVFTDETGKTVASDAIDPTQNMMLITDDRIALELESGKLLYTNAHAELRDGAATADGSGTAIIVLFLGI